MLLLRERYRWKPEDSKKDVHFSFTCPREVTQIRILFAFSPDALTDPGDCLPMIRDAINRYEDGRPMAGERISPESIGPLKNLITISLSKDGVYLGNAHRWQKNQIHELSLTGASPGFVCPDCLEGNWEGMVHLHAVCTPECEGKLMIEGRVSDVLVSC